MVKNDPEWQFFLSHSISQELHLKRLLFLVHMCKMMISSVIFFSFFQNSDFSGFSNFINKCQKEIQVCPSDFSFLDWKYVSWVNLVQKFKIVSLSWSLVPRLVFRICKIWCLINIKVVYLQRLYGSGFSCWYRSTPEVLQNRLRLTIGKAASSCPIWDPLPLPRFMWPLGKTSNVGVNVFIKW